MKFSTLSFFLFLLVLVTACVDASYVVAPAGETENLVYEPFRGTMEMNSDFEIYLADSNSKEFEADIYIEVGERKILFSSVEFDFDLDESNVYGANDCQKYGAHCSGFSTEKRLLFEPAADFWECMSWENCDPDDEVFVFELFVRKTD